MSVVMVGGGGGGGGGDDGGGFASYCHRPRRAIDV